MMVGRFVSGWGVAGEVVKWEPLGSGMCDVLVRCGNGRLVWAASHSLSPTDGLGLLPSRSTAREIARARSITQLRAIRANHIERLNEAWPGAEFGKAIIGRAIDAALNELEKK